MRVYALTQDCEHERNHGEADQGACRIGLFYASVDGARWQCCDFFKERVSIVSRSGLPSAYCFHKFFYIFVHEMSPADFGLIGHCPPGPISTGISRMTQSECAEG